MQFWLVACILLMFSIWPNLAMVLSVLLLVALPIMEMYVFAKSAASCMCTVMSPGQSVLTSISAFVVKLTSAAVAHLGGAVLVIRESFNPTKAANSLMRTTSSLAQTAMVHICALAITSVSAALAWLGCAALVAMRLAAIATEHIIAPAHQDQVAVLWAIVYALSMLYTGWVVSSSLNSMQAFGAAIIASLEDSFYTVCADYSITLTSTLHSTNTFGWSKVVSELWSGTASKVQLLLTLLLLIPHIRVSNNMVVSAFTKLQC